MKFENYSEYKKINDFQKNIENLEHIKKIADAMAPDPTQWEYQGECIDSGAPTSKCTCGHSIRYVFVIHNTQNNKTLPIGSTCIKSTVPYLITCGAKDLAERLEIAQEKLIKEIQQKTANEKKRKREHEQNEKIVEMERDLQEFLDMRKNYVKVSYRDNKFIPYSFYRGKFSMPKACKKPGFTIRRMINAYKDWVEAWAYASYDYKKNPNNSYPVPGCPIPKNTELFNILMNVGKNSRFDFFIC